MGSFRFTGLVFCLVIGCFINSVACYSVTFVIGFCVFNISLFLIGVRVFCCYVYVGVFGLICVGLYSLDYVLVVRFVC